MTLLLSTAYAASILFAVGIGFYVLRGNRFTLAGLAVVTVLVATVMWSVISFVGVHFPFGADSEHPVRLLFWSSLLVAGFRSLVKVLENPSWSPRPLDIINLSVHPWAMGIIAAIPSLHHLMVVADADGNLSYTVGFWIHSAVLVGLSGMLLTRVFGRRRHKSRGWTRKQFVAVLSWALPASGYVYSALMWGPSGPSLAPAFLVLPVAMIGSAVVKDGLVDKLPLARSEVFENLTGAVFVMDNHRRVIDANAAARALAWEIDGAEDIVGGIVDEVCPLTARVLERESEADVPGVSGVRVLSTSSAPLVGGRGEQVGRCVIVRDVTESVMQRRDLERLRDSLSQEVVLSEELRAELGDQVIRDLATGMYNRRFLAEALPDIVRSCITKGSALSVAVFDIDDFKSVNDSRGHVAGDRVIEAVAAMLLDNARGSSMVRYGGDEFLALMPGVSAEQAFTLTEEMRIACSGARVETRDGSVQVTVSAGLATLIGDEIDSEELLELADLRLYQAKNAGRNQTWNNATG